MKDGYCTDKMGLELSLKHVLISMLPECCGLSLRVRNVYKMQLNSTYSTQPEFSQMHVNGYQKRHTLLRDV